MKKLIALFAVSAMASTSAMSAIALSGAASVSYDDNGSAASETTYDADLTVTGTAGTTTVTISADVDGASFATSAASMATTIGPVTIAADMHDEVSADRCRYYCCTATSSYCLLVLLVSKFLKVLIHR